ncbi:MAG: M23 family metallopeptidase [Phormidesmis sp.]
MEIPNLNLTELSGFTDWQATALSQIPGLGDIDFGTLSQLPNVFSGVTATHDISFGAKEHTKTPTKNAITGSNIDGFSMQCAQKRGCANIELVGSGDMNGARWIAGGTQKGQQMVSGGQGILGIINSGQEPTGRLPFGNTFKVVLTAVSETEDTAEFGLYFRHCQRGIPDLGCTPYFLGPVPMPILNSKEGDPVITGLLDGLGGSSSGIRAPKAWENLIPDRPQAVNALLNKYGISSRRSGSLCGDGPGGVNFYALAEAIHSIESNVAGDPYTVPGGLYVDGTPYGYPLERGYALGRYQYMSYRTDVETIILSKPNGQAFLERTFNGQQPTSAEIALFFTAEEQDQLFIKDQTKTIESLIDQGYRGDRILEILGQMHFGGDVIINGTVDSRTISDGFGTLSLWDYGQLTRENYYKALENTGETSTCRESTGTFRNPTAGYKPHDFFDPLGRNGRVHLGVDVGGPLGDPIFAADGGVISIDDHGNDSWGLHITIDHGDSTTLYGHLNSVLVKQGDRVAKGQQIGLLGSTGKSSGPHLHFEVIVNGQHINPDSVVDWNDY